MRQKKYQRSLNLLELLNKKSFFLFGPRATGKSTLIKTQLSSAVVFDLLNYLTRGGLPGIYPSVNWKRELREYVSLYLREEIAAEALLRNIEAYSHLGQSTAQNP